MKTKNIFKAVAPAMMMPAMMLTTACSNEDDAINNTANTENTINKGYALPVTVNVTRQGDATTRATYTDNNDGTGSLAFGADDKLFVEGLDNGGAGAFAGTLDYVSEGTFSGTIYTQNLYEGNADALFTAASKEGYVEATLLPASYKDHDYLVINTNDPDAQCDDFIEESDEYTLATSKAAGVAQFSYEKSFSYNEGFALAPQNAILNFTITGLAASTNVAVSLTGSGYTITGTVTTDGSGNAKFAAGVTGGNNLNDFTLTVAGNPVTLVNSSKTLTAGKIYNITRAVTPPTLAQTMDNADMTVKVKYNYEDDVNYCLFSSNGDGTYTFQSGDGWAGGDNNMAKALVVENGKLVFKQNFFDPIDDQWDDYGFSVTFYSDNSYSQWIPDTEYGSKSHNPSFISVEVNSVPIALTKKITVSDLVKENDQSWSEIIENNPGKIKADGDYVVRISDNAKLQYDQSGGMSGDWQDVMYYYEYQSEGTNKFEGD